MTGYRQITKDAYYKAGAFAEWPRLVRVTRGGEYTYWERC